jgi:hypothetical protein
MSKRVMMRRISTRKIITVVYTSLIKVTILLQD